jgi:ribonuclease R
VIKGKRTGQKIGVGDVVRCVIAAVDVARRQLDLHVLEIVKRGSHRDPGQKPKPPGKHKPASNKFEPRNTGADKRASRSKTRDQRKSGGNAARRAKRK